MTQFFALYFLFVVGSYQQMPTFVDQQRGFAIEYQGMFSFKPGSYALNPSDADTHYVAVFHSGERILFGDFDEISPQLSNFRSHAIRLCIGSEVADGPDGSSWCEDIDSAIVRQNRFGVTYVELFLLKRSEGIDGSESEIVGPYYVIDISTKRSRQSLFLNWRPNWSPTKYQIDASRAIVENLRLIRPGH